METKKEQATRLPETTMAQRLKKLRTEAGETQESLSEYLHMDAKAYGKYEQDKTTPPFYIIIALAEYYGVTTDYILMGKKPVSNDIIMDNLKSLPDEVQVAVINLMTKIIKEISLATQNHDTP